MELSLESFASIIKSAATFIMPAVIGGLYVFGVLRSGSLFPFLGSAWRLIAGKRTVSNPQIADYIQEQHDLASFQFFSGVYLPTLDHAIRLIEWSKATHIPIRWCRRSGKYFDSEALTIKEKELPAPYWSKWAFRLAMFLWIIFVLLLSTAVWPQKAILSFRDDGTYFLASASEAYTAKTAFSRMIDRGQTLNKQSCGALDANGLVPGERFSRTQTHILCEALGSPELNAKIDEAIRSQRFAAGIWAAIFLFFTLQIFSFGLRNVSARKVLAALRDLEAGMGSAAPETSDQENGTSRPSSQERLESPATVSAPTY